MQLNKLISLIYTEKMEIERMYKCIYLSLISIKESIKNTFNDKLKVVCPICSRLSCSVCESQLFPQGNV